MNLLRVTYISLILDIQMFVGLTAYVLYVYTFEFDPHLAVISHPLINTSFYRAHSLTPHI